MMAAPGFQVWQRRLDDPERSVDIGFHRGVEIFTRDVRNRVAALLTCSIADQDVVTAETLDSVVDQFPAKRFLAKVAGPRQADPSFCPYERAACDERLASRKATGSLVRSFALVRQRIHL